MHRAEPGTMRAIRDLASRQPSLQAKSFVLASFCASLRTTVENLRLAIGAQFKPMLHRYVFHVHNVSYKLCPLIRYNSKANRYNSKANSHTRIRFPLAGPARLLQQSLATCDLGTEICFCGPLPNINPTATRCRISRPNTAPDGPGNGVVALAA
jgi:hypothetical protein